MEVSLFLAAILTLLSNLSEGKDKINQYNSFALKCEEKESCSACLEALGCVWCSNPKTPKKHTGSKIHCLPISLNSQNQCHDTIVNPKASFKILENRPLGNQNAQENDLQISPQRVKIEMRKDDVYSFKFKYQQPSNYPLDLYYIMDWSWSMKPSQEKLEQLGGELVKTMRKKTNKFQIGFGSFVDKVTLPFVNTYGPKLKNPCTDVVCDAPFSFRNDLSLTNSSTEFSRGVAKTKLSGNVDKPEGGLDAIMQAMVCEEVIGWRQDARHLVVMSTDASPHIAGDGKLGGVVEPHDLKCHMKNNEYPQEISLRLDYPSISQINHVARENNMHLIFAVIGQQALPYYKGISELIQNSKVGMLAENSNNVIQIIAEIYDEIRETVKITSNSTKDVNITFTSNCEEDSKNGCSVKPGNTVDFSVTVQPLECHEDPAKNKKYIKIKPEGLKDSLIVELEVFCKCSCSKDRIKNSEDCSNEGDLECGICRCNEGRFGKTCQCDKSTSSSDDIDSCIKPGGNEICSGQGSCVCGNCVCNKRHNSTEIISGKYCDCNNFSCKKDCSDHGICKCGVCECYNGYVGDACDCPLSTETCTSPNNDQICSGHGECHCGKCSCFHDQDKRYGKYCEECLTCPSQKCTEFRACVECQAYNSGTLNGTNCMETCTLFQTEIVENLRGGTIKEGVNQCQFVDDQGCTIKFEYRFSETTKNWEVQALEKKICPEPITIWYILTLCAEVIGSILLIGLLTLFVWKQLVTYHDKKEYARFEKEKEHAKWNERNPIYREAKTTFVNPVFGREKD